MRLASVLACALGLVATLLIHSPAAGGPPASPADDWCDNNGFGEPAWSPDGTRIASIVWWIHIPSYFLEMALSIQSPDGGPSSSCFFWYAQSRPAWSPDGREIAFCQGNVLSCVPADSCTYPDFRLVVQASGPVAEPAWSPDGTRIAFSTGGDIAVVPAAGGVAQPLISSSGLDIQPAWSPDGIWLAFASTRSGNSHIFIAPAAGGEARQLTNGGANDTWPTWSPDGRFIAFASDRDGGNHVWSVPAAGGVPVQVTRGGDTETAPAWSPDGMRIAFLSLVGNCSSIGFQRDLRVVSVEPRSWTAMKRLYR